MGLFLDIHTPKYKDKREVLWDMAAAMNQELLALRDAGCRSIQIEEPTLHFWANTYGAKSDEVKFMVECYNREVQGLDDVEIWIHTCWGNPNMQRVIDNTSYRESFELYLHALRGDVWTVEMTDRDFAEIELFGSLKGRLPKKVCIGTVSHRTLQCDRPEDVAARIRRGARAHRPRAAHRLERLRLRAPGRATATSPSSRPPPSRRARTSCGASWASRSRGCRPRTRACRRTSSRSRRCPRKGAKRASARGGHRLGLGAAAAVVDARAQQALEPDEAHRLVQERVHTEAGGGFGAVGQAVGGEHDDGRVLPQVAQVRGDREAFRAHLGGQAHVRDHGVERVAREALGCFLQRAGAVDLEPRAREVGLVGPPHVLVVVDHQKPFTHAGGRCKGDAGKSTQRIVNRISNLQAGVHSRCPAGGRRGSGQ